MLQELADESENQGLKSKSKVMMEKNIPMYVQNIQIQKVNNNALYLYTEIQTLFTSVHIVRSKYNTSEKKRSLNTYI